MKKEGLFVIIQQKPILLGIPLSEVLEVRVKREKKELFSPEEKNKFLHHELNANDENNQDSERYAIIYKEQGSRTTIALTTITMPFIVESDETGKYLKIGLEYKEFEIFRCHK